MSLWCVSPRLSVSGTPVLGVMNKQHVGFLAQPGVGCPGEQGCVWTWRSWVGNCRRPRGGVPVALVLYAATCRHPQSLCRGSGPWSSSPIFYPDGLHTCSKGGRISHRTHRYPPPSLP